MALYTEFCLFFKYSSPAYNGPALANRYRTGGIQRNSNILTDMTVLPLGIFEKMWTQESISEAGFLMRGLGVRF
jgi:hypothetical protein